MAEVYRFFEVQTSQGSLIKALLIIQQLIGWGVITYAIIRRVNKMMVFKKTFVASLRVKDILNNAGLKSKFLKN